MQAASAQPEPDVAEAGEQADAKVEPQSQAELTDEAIQHLQAFIGKSVDEENGKAIFDRYDTDRKGVWHAENLRFFLLDLQQAFGSPRVVPDEAVALVIKELQLNIEASEGISWIEFKSYLIYLQATPLDVLHGVASSCVPDSNLEYAVVINNLHSEMTQEHVLFIAQSHGTIRGLYIVRGAVTQALVAYDSQHAADSALQIEGMNVLDRKLQVERFRGQQFPSAGFVRHPSVAAKKLAKLIVGAREFDDKHKITASVKKGAAVVAVGAGHVIQKVDTFAEEHKIKQNVVLVATKAQETAQEIDRRYDISGKSRQVAQSVTEAAQTVAAYPAVQRGIGIIQQMSAQISAAVSDFSDQTSRAIADEQTHQPAPQQQDVEMRNIDDTELRDDGSAF